MPAYPDSGNTHQRFTVRLDQLIILDALHAAYAGDEAGRRFLLRDADGLARKRLVHRAYRFGQRCKAVRICFSAACDLAIRMYDEPVLPRPATTLSSQEARP